MDQGGSGKSPATIADLLAIPDEVRSHELLDGEIVEREPESVSHGAIEFGLLAFLRPFQRPRPGAGAGWLFTVSPEVAFGPHDVCRPLLAGWRREQLAEIPTTIPLPVVPEFLVDLESPARQEEGERRVMIYHRAAVPHLWLLELETQRLRVFRRQSEVFEERLVATRGARVFAEPFASVELSVAELFGDYD